MLSHRKNINTLLILSLLVSPLYGNIKTLPKPSLYAQIQKEFPTDYLVNEQEKAQNVTVQSFTDQIKHLEKTFTMNPLNQEEQRTVGLKILSQENSSNKELLDMAGRKDLELLNQANLHSIINRTNTTMGELVLAKVLSEPTSDVTELLNRQALISQFLQDKELFESVDKALKQLGSTEKTYLTLWQAMDPIQETFVNQLHYFNVLSRLNKNSLALGASGQLNKIFSGLAIVWEPLFIVIYGYSILRSHGINIGDIDFKTLGSNALTEFRSWPTEKQLGISAYAAFILGMIGYGKVQTIRLVKLNIASANFLQNQLIELASCIRSLRSLNEVVTRNNLKGFEALTELFDENSKHSADLKKLLKLLNTNTFKGQASAFSRIGRILAAHKIVKEVKNELRNALEAAGRFDAFLSMTKLVKEFESKRVNYCFVEFINNNAPYLTLNEFWNPLVNPDVVVPNNIILGKDHARNMVLTGPNTGGKSTVIKGITLNIVLAQTFGVAAAKSMKLTPVDVISTNINITDNVKENLSLFAAETARAKHVLDSMDNLGSAFGFCVFDETFRGTAPDQAEKLSVWYAKELAKYPNVIGLHATHYPSMINLEQDAQSCKNYKVEIKKLDNGSLQRDYKLKEGSTLFNVAEDILKEQGLIR